MPHHIDYDSKPKHEETQIALDRLIADLRADVNAETHPDKATYLRAKTEIGYAIDDIAHCAAGNHHRELWAWLMALEDWLDKKDWNPISHAPIPWGVYQPTDECLTRGQRLVDQLDDCREKLRWER